MKHFTQTGENRLALTLQGIDKMTSELFFFFFFFSFFFLPVSGFYEGEKLKLKR